MKTIIDHILFEYSYPALFALSFGYFLFLYFGLGSLFLLVCRTLERLNILHKIIPNGVRPDQVGYEIKHSLLSIVVFGLSIIPIVFLIRNGTIELLPDTWINVFIGLLIFTLWNEVHFYIVHRFMHLKFMMKHVHSIHHRSTVPTVYSVYSFHWMEAFLLSTVSLTLAIFLPFSILAIFLYPMVSILLNFAGHCNHRFGHGEGDSALLFGTHHNEHHSKARRNYGFALNLLDKWFTKQNDH